MRTTDKPAPSLRPHRIKQELHRYYGPVRLRAPATVLSSSRFRRLEVSLSPPPAGGGSVGARHPTFRTKAAGQARATSAPGTTWPAIRATARLIPGQAVTPGSDATFLNNDAINGESLAGLLMQRLPGPHLTHHVRLFPLRSPRRSSAYAAEGGLKPPPEGRLREADNLSSLVQHRFQPPIASGSLQRSWHTGFFQELKLHLLFPGLPLKLAQPRSLIHGQRRLFAGVLTAIDAHPVTEGAFVDSELLCHSGNRARRLDHHLHGFVLEFR